MAGIYIHIPFCKTKCIYCDFYSITDFEQQKELVDSLILEIKQRNDYLKEQVNTIYFGGGTPSTLSVSEIDAILRAFFKTFQIEKDTEITLEANPDDLTLDYLKKLRNVGINRLSMGVQSFDDAQLKAINRRHSAQAALNSIEMAHRAGFSNISIDLIYGLPGQSLESWKEQVDKAISLDVQHISAYGLIYEENTPLWRDMKAGRVIPTDDETMIDMYNYLVATCRKNGFEQYEIANFAKNGYRSRHNSSYWKQQPYLGIGPAAHSYDGDSRQWNISSIRKYCKNIANNEPYFEKEILSEQDKYNDFVMVSLRTMDGINLAALKRDFNEKYLEHCINSAKKYLENNKLHIKEDFLRLSPDGVMLSDRIIVDLMKVGN
ncbi:MAG: radical SAM family heme chaperone HemW [Porphyromonadaceae bacterium]|nr:radical SAM family heme chaperone HemW [Porphyromonadaceae bacterium]